MAGVKKSIYFNDKMYESLSAEAARLDRPLSWVLKIAWDFAEKKIAALPDAPKLMRHDEEIDQCLRTLNIA